MGANLGILSLITKLRLDARQLSLRVRLKGEYREVGDKCWPLFSIHFSKKKNTRTDGYKNIYYSSARLLKIM